MAHPPDAALSRALSDVIDELGDQGWSPRRLAEELGVDPATISRWRTGARAFPIDRLPAIDALCGQRRGYVLRLAGYVEDDPSDVRAAIMADESLDPLLRELLVANYDGMRKAWARRSKVSPRPARVEPTT